MSQLHPPRRALFAADPVTGSWLVESSAGWPGEDAAQQAAWLLDTDVASVRIADFAGFFTIGPVSWAIARGCVAPEPNPTGRYWRETAAIDEPDFAKLRFNPFRILPGPIPTGLESSRRGLAPPDVPMGITAEDDLRRLSELIERVDPAPPFDDIEPILAAVLEHEHTLALSTRWSYEQIELLLLLLPPRLRRALTFHSCAMSLPKDPVPRLVLSPVDRHAPFETGAPLWGARLPGGGATSAPARAAARDLLRLLEAPERLVAAHDAYERDAGNRAPAALLNEIERLLPERGTTAASAVPSKVDDAPPVEIAPAHVPTVSTSSVPPLTRRSPADIAADLATQLREGHDLAGAAVVLEGVLARRHSHPLVFAEFARALGGIPEGSYLVARDNDAARVRAMMLLLAASRGDAAGVACALTAPIAADVVGRLGGMEAWIAPEYPRVTDTVLAVTGVRGPEDAADALRALGSLSDEIDADAKRPRLAQAGVHIVREAFRVLPAERWAAALPIGAAAVELCNVATASGRIALDGRTDTELLAHDAQRGSGVTPVELGLHADAEVFFAFLGVQSTRSRVAHWEIAERGNALVAEVLARIGPGTNGETAAQAVHWSLSLLERVRRREVDDQFGGLAARLLRLGAGERASAAVRAYLEQHPAVLHVLFAQADLRGALTRADLVALLTAVLDGALVETAQVGEAGAATALCERVREAGLLLTEAEFRAGLGERLRRVASDLGTHPTRDPQPRLAALGAALTPILEPSAHDALRGILRPPPRPVAQDDDPALRALAEKSSGVRFPRVPRRVVLLAASVVVIVGAAVLYARLGSAGGVLPGPVQSVGSALRAMTPRAANASAPGEAVSAAVAEARTWAMVDDYERVLQLLSAARPARGTPEAFAWDSLLAISALGRAQQLPSQDNRRRTLLRTAAESSDRAIASLSPFAPGLEELRLLRADACIQGRFDCAGMDVKEDLILASRSASADVRNRAMTLLARLGR